MKGNPHPIPRGRVFSEADDAAIRKGARAELSMREIGKLIGRTKNATLGRWYRLRGYNKVERRKRAEAEHAPRPARVAGITLPRVSILEKRP